MLGVCCVCVVERVHRGRTKDDGVTPRWQKGLCLGKGEYDCTRSDDVDVEGDGDSFYERV